MKSRKTRLHLYRQNPTSPLFTQKNMDTALVIVSLSGLLSALFFLLTMH